MGIADLPAAVAQDLAGRALLGLDESRVGEELLDTAEAIDVLDLVEQHEREDSADTGDAAQQVIAEGVVALGHERKLLLEGFEQAVVVTDQGQIQFNRLPDDGIRKVFWNRVSLALTVDSGPERRQTVLAGLNECQAVAADGFRRLRG